MTKCLEIRFGREFKMYTLWMVTMNGQFFNERYIRNLSTKYDEAIEKANKYNTMDLILSIDAPENLNDIVRGDDVLRFGKYKDHRISEITDVKYLKWIFGGCSMPNKTNGEWYPTKDNNDPIVLKVKEHMVNIGEAILYNDKIITIDHYNKLKQWEEKSSKSEFVGEVGKRLKFDDLVVERIIVLDGYDYVSTIYSFIDKDGNFLTTKRSTSLCVNKGDVITIKGTIKEHTTYKDTKQTNLSRVTIL